jgi:hypothetical protein
MKTMRSATASLTVRKLKGRKLAAKQTFRVTVAGVDAKGKPVTGSTRTVRL